MMNIKENLLERSGAVCELCGSAEELIVHSLLQQDSAENCVLLCQNCHEQIAGTKQLDANHWRCLNTSMWSTVPSVQALAWRVLNQLRHEGWPQDLLDMLYLDDETLALAKAGSQEGSAHEDTVVHKDSNGTVLSTGDTVVLIKDLDVKGGGFTAKRGTAVKNITLVEGNAEQIEGKVSGQQIVILTKFVKKA